MKRLILLALIATPLIALSLDRLGSGSASPRDEKISRLAFAFPAPPVPPAPPVLPAPPVPPAPPLVGHHQGHDHDAMPDCCTFAGVGEAGEPLVVVESDGMAGEDRALANLRETIETRVGDWLADAGVPLDWTPPTVMVEGLIRGEPAFRTEAKEYGTVYWASVPVELSRPEKQRLVHEYHRQTSVRRMGQLGAGFVFVLACLGIVAGYIRTDEATRGYYTNRLRLLAAGALGAAGVALYRMLV